MSKPLHAFSLTVGIVALSSLEMTSLHAKQQCSAAMPPNPQGQWWSYRIIDGRKCWYAGKPMLSKALLEWPTEQRPQPGSRGEATGILIANKPGNPLDAQALALKEGSDTFEERWRARISISNTARD
ncbi:hypothetical protein ABIF65_005428 [Bradyrhizobium japonicum]|uniref:hypothetical protein n=1 Tax=Bradyrhizobium TaxID=374 RepID=UPI001FD91A75|nr:MULTISPECIES: hypothetical protein [Bradyrhizobium]MCP1743763.1 hypothetical protein [Bradyrhizobium japonicum]MCP1782051.1 hypothetical protein [Bradyrhizobium japonicum]MCP1861477.1 hypothetical protein [Bradyrhizobium japonicum]MCP1892237.1 hypothetical protein [Bradyrhizobium japonicum]MCP1965662.1 hypothetical protein [Bradyrhizobium japonicum]